MFGRNETKVRPPRVAKTDPTSRNGQEPGAAAPSTRLTIVGQQSRVEGKFEIADSIQIESEVGGKLMVGGRLVIGEHDALSGPRPAHLVEDKRVGAQK
jgi:hypothetical protein